MTSLDRPSPILSEALLNQVDQRIAARKKGMSVPIIASHEAQSPEQIAPETPMVELPPEQGAGPDWYMTGPSGLALSAVNGINGMLLETKDFVMGGEPKQEEKSFFRLAHERTREALRSSSAANSITIDVSQFTAGLIGAGKVMAPIKGGMEAAKFGKATFEVARTAAAGYVAMDPHQERLSNLLVQYPLLQNPVTEYLAADPNDSAMEGRLKNALEGMGMDLALIGVFAATVKATKYFRAGDEVKGQAALKEAEELQAGGSRDEMLNRQLDVVADEAGFEKAYSDVLDAANTPTPGGVSASPVPPSDAMVPPKGGRDGKLVGQLDDMVDEPGFQSAHQAANEVHPSGAASAVPDASPKLKASDAPSAPVANVEASGVRSEAEAVPLKPQDETYKPSVKIEEADVAPLIVAARAEAAAIKQFGSREAAIEAGATSSGPSLPWQKINSTEDVEALVASTTRSIQSQMDAAKGGAVLTDAKVQGMIRDSAEHFGADPDIVLAEISKSGDAATHLVADMESAFIISRKLFEDAHSLAVKIEMGMLDEFSGDAAKAQGELLRRFTVAADMMAQGGSMRAAFGRGMRRLRSQFAITPKDIEAFKNLPPEKLTQLLVSTGGNTKKLASLANPTVMRRLIDEGTFLLTNNLLWNWTSHAVNTTTNLYMLAARPTEKLIGSLAMGSKGSAIRRQAMKEYAYTLYSVSDAWHGMVDAFLKADSSLTPSGNEFMGGSRTQHPVLGLKPIRDTWDLFYNGMASLNFKQMGQAAGATAEAGYRVGVGMPTRLLGSVDEGIKQLRYRSVVQAKASVEGSDAGLKGADLKKHIEDKLEAAFAPDGSALDDAAVREAQTTTFQQDLLEGTAGKAVQNFRHNWPAAAFILPFVKTPINVLRYATKMTFGLNFLQKEYRQMLTGKLGAEAQAHAMGQTTMGALFMGTAANLALSGRLTGGGPSDPDLKKQLQATGWQPYSIIYDNADGTKGYFPIGRFDPVGMSFGMVADLVDMLHTNPNSRKGEQGIMAVGIALASSFTEKTFLMNLNQAMKAITDPGTDGQNLTKYLGTMASNMIPGASGWRAYANPDPYLREARTFLDKMMSGMPGSDGLPPQRDSFGDPMWRKRGLTTNSDTDFVEDEHNRIIMETGQGIRPPVPQINGVDLRSVTLSDGKNAFDAYQVLVADPAKGKNLKETLARLMQSPGYARLIDGDGQMNGTKLAAIMDVVGNFREAGRKALLSQYPELRKKVSQSKLDLRAQLKANQTSNTSQPNVQDLLKSLGY